MKRKHISIGILCYNEEQSIPHTYAALKKTLHIISHHTFTLLLIDNGSTDSSRRIITELAKKNKNIIGIFLSRNFGPEASIQAAIDNAKGDALILYDGDMQDPPSMIPKLIQEWENGYDVVVGKYTKTADGTFMRVMRKYFYKLFKAISNIDVPVNAGTFGLLDKRVVEAIRMLPEKYRFYRGLRAWVGFRTKYLLYERKKRMHGRSSTNFFGYISYSQRSFFGFSYLPLDMIIYLGFFLVGTSFIAIAFYLLFSLFFGNPIKGSIALFVSIIFFGGIQLLAISVIGKYIQVIVEETKNRPVYIIDEIINKKV